MNVNYKTTQLIIRIITIINIMKNVYFDNVIIDVLNVVKFK